MSTVLRLKGDIENGINMTSWNSLHKLLIAIFGITQKFLWIIASNMSRWLIIKERKLVNKYSNWEKGPLTSFWHLFFLSNFHKRRLGLKTKNEVRFFLYFWLPFLKTCFFQKSFLNVWAVFLAIYQNNLASFNGRQGKKREDGWDTKRSFFGKRKSIG